MAFIFMVEEPSMKAFLEAFIPRHFSTLTYKIIPHQGKTDLLNSIPRKLKAWTQPEDCFVILIDQDSNDCKTLKKEIQNLCVDKPSTLIRIVCKELESWFLGDLEAVGLAYDVSLQQLQNKAKYRNPDNHQAFDELKKLLKQKKRSIQKISNAGLVGQYMDLNSRNTSISFQAFISGLQHIIDLVP
jgi:hypothetical protein